VFAPAQDAVVTPTTLPGSGADRVTQASTPPAQATVATATAPATATPAPATQSAAETAPPVDAAAVVAAATDTAERTPTSSPAATMPAVLQALSPALRRGPAFSSGTHDSDTVSDIAASRTAAPVAPVGGPATSGGSGADSDNSRSTSQSDSAASQAALPLSTSGATTFAGVADASALTATGAIGAAAAQPAPIETVAAAGPAVHLADAADKLMYRVVQTIHSFQTAAGPAIEARVNDPAIGDVRMIVTGRAGEMVQAELVVRDKVTADAMTAAAARMHSSGDELAGVSVTVRTEGGNSSTSGRSGSNPFEAGGWAGTGYAAGNGSGGAGNHGQGLGNGQAAGAGTGGQPGGGNGNAVSATPKPLPATRPEPVRANQPSSGTPTSRGPSLDIMA
jgi:trimeric autotransporter adhesin